MRKTWMMALLILMSIGMQAKVKVHTIGDSTMADYDESTTDKRGWCTYLGNFFDANEVTVNNRGKSGASSRTFYTGAAYWQSVKSQMTTGDYVLIQFAHNDENNAGLDVLEYNAYLRANGQDTITDMRGTTPFNTYKQYLRLYVDETRALGCTPVLVAPICRKYFSGNTIRRNGQHDLGDKFDKLENGVLTKDCKIAATDHTMDYVQAMRDVATEKGVTFIDMTTATRDLYLQYGEAQCTSLLFCQGDNTHTATLGANLIARLGAQLLSDAGVLAQYITIPTDISAAPAIVDFGEAYSGAQLSKEILLTGFGLEPATGSVSISATSGLQISVDNQTFGQTASATYSGSTLFQKIYVHATLTSDLNESVTVTSGNTNLTIPVTARLLQLGNGTPFCVSWALAADDQAVITGPVAHAEEVLSNLQVAKYATIGDIGKMQLLEIPDSVSGSWPANEIDEVATRYADFVITAPQDVDLQITKIEMTVAGNGGNGVCAHVNYGVGDDFTGVVTIFEKVKMSNKAANAVSAQPVLRIAAGDSFHVRVLPWYNGAATGKWICVSNVLIEGVSAGEETAISEISATNSSIAYDLLGRPVGDEYKGIVICDGKKSIR